MKNFEYERRFENEGSISLDPVETEVMGELLQMYESYLRSRPHFIHPSAPKVFKQTIADCERIAKAFSGRIKAKIDYTLFTATIELWCSHVEFDRGEFLCVLHEISHYAISIRFSTLTSGKLHIEIEMPYFIAAQGYG